MSSTMDHVNGTATSQAEAWAMASVHEAKAEAIRAQTASEAEVRRIAAEAEAEAVRLKAAAEAEKQALANKRAALQLQRFEAEQAAKIAEANRKAAAEARLATKERIESEAAEAEAAEKSEKREESARAWRKTAIRFAVVCAAAALPVQLSMFYNPDRLYLLSVPLVIEGAAWAALKGAAAAVDDERPHWHYRLIAWVLAFVAAGINLGHGLTDFDTTTAIAAALASLAGPGMWDLHEHGRIRSRDGKPTWRQRRATRKAERAEAKEAARREARQLAEKKIADAKAEEDAKLLAEDREANFPEIWKHALKLAAALGEATVTEAVWKRAHRDIEGTDPGDSVDIIRGRNAAERRLIAARSEAPGNRPVKAANAQRASQMPPASGTRVYRPPTRAGVRRKGDTQKYVPAANRQAAITAKAAAEREGETA
ncbi:hypothetical protein ACFWJT_15815 [Streptomyces sp. NPDC127069]|uniref:hypothetical protein n=1 Tax=Streptomyces sp. NPDC127069 TaxID=3347128 RepID=UPI00364E2711